MKKPVILSDTERQFLIYQIKKKAQSNPVYADHVEQRLAEIRKQQLKKKI